jgi:hypothetical protein
MPCASDLTNHRHLKTDLTGRMPDERKKKAAFIGAGLIALVGAVWTDTYFSATENEGVVVTPPVPSTSSTAPETTFDVCIGEHYFRDRHIAPICEVNIENYINT